MATTMAARPSAWVRLNLPLNFVTAPLIGDLFLIAILAIGEKEVREGTLGANHISPLDIMLFFISLAYIAISIDASGVIRFLAFKVLQWGGEVGHRLFFYLYAFWFVLTSCVGNDPVILSGTAFLAYMTRVSSNIVHPRAWIFSQFAVANIGSAILVSSNPTNLVLAGAFRIKFIEYTANMIVPVLITGIVLFPFLLFIVFNDESLVPRSIKMHELPEELRTRKPINPNIPHGRGAVEEQEDAPGEQGKLLSLEEIMNPFLDRKGAMFGAVLMALTLIAVLALNAATSSKTQSEPVFYVTLPAAFVMFVWDVAFGWIHRDETRKIAREGREEVERLRMEREAAAAQLERSTSSDGYGSAQSPANSTGGQLPQQEGSASAPDEKDEIKKAPLPPLQTTPAPNGDASALEKSAADAKTSPLSPRPHQHPQQHTTLVSITRDVYRWLQETFPTATAVMSHLPFALVPFAFSMFVLVQALVTKGWVSIFALGWDAWVRKTGTIGAIAGMGFLSVLLCNVSSLLKLPLGRLPILYPPFPHP